MMMNQRQGEKKQLQKTEACDLRAGVGAEHSLVNVSGENNITTNNRGSDPIHDYYDQNHYYHHQLGLVHFGNVNKKKRMARQRRSSTNTTFMYQLNPFSSKQTPVTPPPPPPFLLPPTTSHVQIPPSPACETDHGKLKFLFQKELKNSDVSSLRRMVLPKKAAETFLPALESKEGILIRMDDLDGIHVWNFKYRISYCEKLQGEMLTQYYVGNCGCGMQSKIPLTTKIYRFLLFVFGQCRYWPNNNSRMYVLENTGDFVNTHGLRLGDSIMVYQDTQNNNYAIQAKKAYDNDEFMEETSDTTNDIFLNDYEVNKPGCFSITYPSVNDTGMSFIYDTTFSNDSPFDFLGGSMTNLSRTGTDETFGSVDNLSLDDFY
ncbi:putative transcription factor B3-Domain family [Lupinus albus]|uniref:Putative transcription factor B3-Domain family n=1 Tax=Lupinus albus TaxID=3870 RepID=A0A6A4NMR8_LUPAL|nr:putative transcription factor B3-Domain family [Lupinus albus]